MGLAGWGGGGGGGGGGGDSLPVGWALGEGNVVAKCQGTNQRDEAEYKSENHSLLSASRFQKGQREQV